MPVNFRRQTITIPSGAGRRTIKRTSFILQLVCIGAVMWLGYPPVKAQTATRIIRADRSVTTEVAPQKRVAMADVRSVTVRESFSVGYSFGDRDVFKVNIERAGALTIQARWQGSASSLALVLNGPGQRGYYARQDGPSPLKINFEVTQELLNRGSEWTVSIVNFSGQGSASGMIFIESPAPLRKLIELAPVQRAAIMEAIKKRPTSDKTEQRILPDGTVEIRYPDGRIVRTDGCNRTIIFPDGTTQARETTELEASFSGIKISSPILGIIILIISFLFFYLYLVHVYPISEIF